MKFALPLVVASSFVACSHGNDTKNQPAGKPVAEPTSPRSTPASPAPKPDKGTQSKRSADEEEVLGIARAEKKRRMAEPLYAPIKATLQKLADGTFDVASEIDPSTPFVYLDHSRGMANLVEREICGTDVEHRAELGKDLARLRARLTKALADRQVDCGPYGKHVQCSIDPSSATDATLLLAFEIVLEDAQLRGFAKERSDVRRVRYDNNQGLLDNEVVELDLPVVRPQSLEVARLRALRKKCR